MSNIRYAFRRLRSSPGFTAIAIVTIALGVGANTAIFSLVNAVLLRPLAARNPAELVTVWTSDFSGPLHGATSYPDFRDFRELSGDVLSGIGAMTHFAAGFRNGERMERVFGELVSGNYFDVLGVPAALGRTFAPEEDSTPGTHPVVMVSHGFWRRRLNADPSAVGRSITLQGSPYTVIGVMPEKFTSVIRVLDVDVWVPAAMQARIMPRSDSMTSRSSRGFLLIGRLREGVGVEQAQSKFNVIAAQLHQSYRQQWTDRRQESRRVTVVPESDSRVPPRFGNVKAFMALLMAVVGTVLLIACANLANLLLARTTARRREISVRMALGANRARVVRELMTENVLVAFGGGAAGILLSAWITDLLKLFKPPLPAPVLLDFSPDYRVLLFALAISVVTGLLMGLAPALHATRGDLTPALKESALASPGGLRRFSVRNVLVVAQTAASFVLLTGAGLFLRSLQNAYSIDLGFKPDGVVIASIEMGLGGYKAERGPQLYDLVIERARALPGVESATFAHWPLLGMQAQNRRGMRPEGYERGQHEDMETHFNVVGPGYFSLLGIPIVKGREFSLSDRHGAPLVAVVSEAFARKYWPGQNAIGKRLTMGGRGDMEVVGVAADAKYVSLSAEPPAVFFAAEMQHYSPGKTLHLKSSRNEGQLLSDLRRELRALDPDLPVISTMSLRDHMGTALLPVRVGGTLLSAFGALGLLLAAVGIYGVMSFLVEHRTREIGIRMAIGAEPRDIAALVLRYAAGLTAAGVAIGLAIALGVTRFLETMLYGVGSKDPLTFALVPAGLMLAALAACLFPARRASRVDPMTSLRE